jgi:hypothetical protein
MAPYNRWAQPPFLQTLLDSCDAYLASSDRGSEKTRSKLITKVSEELTAISERTHEPLPDDLEKVILLTILFHIDNDKCIQCVRIWFGNYAAAHAKEERQGNSKSDGRGRATSSRTWTAKSVCSHEFSDRISDEQKRLSENGEKDIGKYRAALSNVFGDLTDEQRKQCEELAVEWNTKPLPEYVQLK